MDLATLEAFLRGYFTTWAPPLFAVVGLVALGWIGGGVAQRAVVAIMRRGRFAGTHQAFFGGLVRWLVIGLALTACLDVVGLGGIAAGLMAGGGVTAVVLGFAFREIGENILAGVLLAFSRPFEIGDFVKSAEVEGKVVQLDLRTVHVRTGDGRDIWIPNSQVVNQPFTNFTLDGMRRPSFEVGIDYGDDARAACVALQAMLTQVPDVLEHPAPAVVIKALDGSWVTLKGSFWVDTTKLSSGLDAVVSEVLDGTRLTLRRGGYTLSCDTTTAVVLHQMSDVQVRLAEQA